MFRILELPDTVPGKIFLHSMPGRFEPLEDSLKEIADKQISSVVSLASFEEIEQKSPDFAKAIASDSFMMKRTSFPIQDYGLPSDPNEFVELSNDVAKSVLNGDRVLIHCAAGIGRTGMLATSVLISLGIDLATAKGLVRTAGSGAETPEQADLLAFVANAQN